MNLETHCARTHHHTQDSWGRLEDVWSVVNHSMFLSRVRASYCAFFYS